MRRLSDLIVEFLLSLEARGASPNTIRAYRQDLRAFESFAPSSWAKLKADHFEAFVTRAGYSEAVQNRRRAALASFCRWLETEGMQCPSAPERAQRFSLLELEAYALSVEDRAFLANARDPHRLMLALTLVVAREHLVLLRDRREVPEPLVAYVAQQLDSDPERLEEFRGSWSTRAADGARIREYLGVVRFTSEVATRLQDHLVRACRSTGNLSLLPDEVEVFMREARVLQPGFGVLQRIVQDVRAQVEEEFIEQVESKLSEDERAALDGMCAVGGGLIADLRATTRRFSLKSAEIETERLGALKALLPRREDEWRLPIPLQRRWSGMVKKLKSQSLRRMPDRQRRALLAVFVRHQVAEVTDRVVEMLERLVSRADKNSKKDLVVRRLERDAALAESIGAFRDMAEVMLDGDVSEEGVREATFRRISKERMRALLDQVRQGLGDETRHFVESLLKRSSNLRAVFPSMLAQLDLEGTPRVQDLLRSLDMLCDLRATRARIVPENVPDGFVPERWRESVSLDRPTMEVAALLGLRDALKQGDVTVRHSRRYDRWDRALHDEAAWRDRRDDWYSARDVPSDGQSFLESRLKALHEYALEVADALPRNPFARVKDGRFVLGRNDCTSPPEGLDAMQARLYALRPKITLPQLLYAVDRWTDFSHEMTDLVNPLDEYHHRGTGREALFACIVAEATNIGLSAMADASGIDLEKLRRARDRFLREDTCRAAIRRLLDYHAGLPMTAFLGSGKTSASDGMRLLASSSLNARPNPRYFGTRTGVTLYSFISDQSVQFYIDLMSSHLRDATMLIDGIVQRQDDEIQEHYTDTHGYTEIIFGLCALLGIDFAPRISGMGSQKLYRPGRKGLYGVLEPVFAGPVKPKRILTHWDDMNRLAASIRDQCVRPSDAIRRLQATKKLNPVAGALADLGCIAKTQHVLRYVSDPAYRARIRKGLNLIERLHSLARTVLFGRQGRFLDGKVEDQVCRATALSLVLNAIIVWNTQTLGDCAGIIEVQGVPIPPDYWSHISPIAWEHIQLVGRYDFTEVRSSLS